MTSTQTVKSENPYLEGFLAPVEAEVTATDLSVTGHIPDHLDGRYLRNGPNPAAEVDPATYHWFSGDAMIHGVALRDGQNADKAALAARVDTLAKAFPLYEGLEDW